MFLELPDAQWVVVIHIVSPACFFVRYVAEEIESENLAKKISDLCCSGDCFYTPTDTVQTGECPCVTQVEVSCTTCYMFI